MVPTTDGKEAVEQLKAIYPQKLRLTREARNLNAELDITAPSSKLGELALQHRGTGSSSSAQHPKRMLSLSLLQVQVRTLLPRGRVMTSNRARHELIQLPTIVQVRLLGTRRQSGTVPGTVPDLAGDGDAPPSPSPICPE